MKFDKGSMRTTQFGVLIEPGEIHFFQAPPPKNFFRLGFNAIRPDAIVPGVQKLAKAMMIVGRVDCNISPRHKHSCIMYRDIRPIPSIH